MFVACNQAVSPFLSDPKDPLFYNSGSFAIISSIQLSWAIFAWQELGQELAAKSVSQQLG
jgi:hypothetical protein